MCSGLKRFQILQGRGGRGSFEDSSCKEEETEQVRQKMRSELGLHFYFQTILQQRTKRTKMPQNTRVTILLGRVLLRSFLVTRDVFTLFHTPNTLIHTCVNVCEWMSETGLRSVCENPHMRDCPIRIPSPNSAAPNAL